jgi:hypothetical protein
MGEKKPRRSRSKFAKTDLRYWRETVFKPEYSRGDKTLESPNWAMQIKHQGRRTMLSLGTPNKEEAGRQGSRHLSFAESQRLGSHPGQVSA